MSDFHDMDLADILFSVTGHFVISILAGTMIYLGYRKHFHRVLLAAVLVVFIDIDHLSFFRGISGGALIFHNLLFAFLIPLICMITLMVRAKERHEYSSVYTAALFFVMLSGHIFYDGMDMTPVLYYYPFSMNSIMFSDLFTSFAISNTMNVMIIGIIYFTFLVLVFNRIISILALDEERHMNDDETALEEDAFWSTMFPSEHLTGS